MILRGPAARAVFDPAKMGKADLYGGAGLFAGLNAFEPGQSHEPHVHCGRDKLYVVLEGGGEVTIGETTEHVSVGDIAVAPAGVIHAVRNPGPDRLVLLTIIGPPPQPR